MDKEILEYWPVCGRCGFDYSFRKAFNRIEVLEEKVKTLWNDKNK